MLSPDLDRLDERIHAREGPTALADARRLRAAMVALARGAPVASTASQVGYDSTDAFVHAFRRETGAPPATYFRRGGNPPGRKDLA